LLAATKTPHNGDGNPPIVEEMVAEQMMEACIGLNQRVNFIELL